MTDTDMHLSEDAIRLRSFQIWQREGCPHDKSLEHWLCAKAELEAELRAGRPLSRPIPFVVARVPICLPPNRRVAEKISRNAA